ncbi:MAG: heme ABC exporter ATP-binding protein CcmA [Pseudorhodoplanes sp.]|nr:heme ABC exporter ATP-binding protein CcmA [Pseudorhodoplanes sp.]
MRLTATDLACERGGRMIFSALCFSVSSGEALVVTGRNGAGKSSLLRMVAGFLAVAAGRLDLAGGDPERSIGEQAHYLGHQDALKPALTVAENLAFWTAWLGGTGDVRGALAAVGLDTLSHLPAGYLSAGQRRRLSLARLAAVARPLWLLDEPSSALDTAAQNALRTLMHDHLARGGIILAATHMPLGLEGARSLEMGVRP